MEGDDWTKERRKIDEMTNDGRWTIVEIRNMVRKGRERW